MKKIYLATLLLFWCACASAAGVAVRGRVVCAGRGVEGVWVSDGESFARTDKQGRYRLAADDRNRFVFVCVPSGYEAPSEGGVVRFFNPLPADGKSCDFSLTQREGSDEKHGFVVIADPQIWARKEFVKLGAAADDIAATVGGYADRAFHGLCCGDIVSHDHSFYGEYNDVMSRTGLAFHNAIGNHDMQVFGRSHETSFAKFEAMYGPVYYSFDMGRIHYVVLDDTFFIGRDYFYIGYLEERQMRWLEQDLSHIEAGSTVVVCMHIPSTCDEADRKQFRYQGAGSTLINHRGLYDILKPFRAHILSGHTHTAFNQPLAENLYEQVVPALSGAWWQGALCTDGTPSGYAVYEADGSELSWYYKSTGCPADYQMELYCGAEYPEFAGYAVANIWASDKEWKVTFTIDGASCGAAERFEAYDPAAKRMYATTDHLDHKWIYPSLSDHFYRVPLPEGAKNVTVEATDRFGRRYRAEKTIQ